MTKLLEHAFAKARALTEAEQDALAVAMLGWSEADGAIEPLDEQSRAAIRRGLEQARRGEAVPASEIEALWKRYGV
jgi:predicted transcriptional regulator